MAGVPEIHSFLFSYQKHSKDSFSEVVVVVFTQTWNWTQWVIKEKTMWARGHVEGLQGEEEVDMTKIHVIHV